MILLTSVSQVLLNIYNKGIFDFQNINFQTYDTFLLSKNQQYLGVIGFSILFTNFQTRRDFFACGIFSGIGVRFPSPSLSFSFSPFQLYNWFFIQ